MNKLLVGERRKPVRTTPNDIWLPIALGSDVVWVRMTQSARKWHRRASHTYSPEIESHDRAPFPTISSVQVTLRDRSSAPTNRPLFNYCFLSGVALVRSGSQNRQAARTLTGRTCRNSLIEKKCFLLLKSPTTENWTVWKAPLNTVHWLGCVRGDMFGPCAEMQQQTTDLTTTHRQFQQATCFRVTRRSQCCLSLTHTLKRTEWTMVQKQDVGVTLNQKIGILSSGVHFVAMMRRAWRETPGAKRKAKREDWTKMKKAFKKEHPEIVKENIET